MNEITHILPVRAFGNMIGSTICGFILTYFDHQVVLIFSMLAMSLSIIFVPLCTNLWILYAAMIVNGMSGGFLVNAGNCFVIHKWGKENSPFMQMAHFSFGIGAFFSPFIVEPFLREVGDIEAIEGVSSSVSTNSTDLDVHKTLIVDPSTLKLKWAYFIIGGLSLFFWILFVITYLNKKDNKPHPTRQVKVKEANNNETFVKIEIVKLDEQKLESAKSDEKSKNDVPAVLDIEKKIRPYHKYVLVLLAGRF